MRFQLTPEEMRERRSNAGRKRAAQQKADKAFGWNKHTRERTRLSVERPDRKAPTNET
jgi:hypothetical protein